MIQVEHLTKRFGDNVAVDDLSFTAQPGRIYGFLGPNGAGKSTTMNMMTGYLAPTSGDVKIEGFDIMKQPEEAKRQIGYLPEVPPVYTDMTVLEYLRFAAELKKVPASERDEAVRKAMARTELVDVKGRLIRNLSKGYRQRVGLAQAVINDPAVIILDEPTAGLDPEQQKEMFDYIRSLRGDHTIILSSHILSDINAVCDYVWIISKGRLIASDTPEGLRSSMSGAEQIVLEAGGSPEVLSAVLLDVKGVETVSVTAGVSETSKASGNRNGSGEVSKTSENTEDAASGRSEEKNTSGPGETAAADEEAGPGSGETADGQVGSGLSTSDAGRGNGGGSGSGPLSAGKVLRLNRAVVSCAGGEEDLRPAVAEALVTAGIPLYSLRRSETSLEDVFLTLTQDDSAAAAVGGNEADVPEPADADKSKNAVELADAALAAEDARHAQKAGSDGSPAGGNSAAEGRTAKNSTAAGSGAAKEKEAE